VSTHVASSSPAARFPAMCRSETLTMVVSSTSINVANITAAAISPGLKFGADGVVCGSAEAGAATSVFPSVFFVSEFIVASFLGALISSPASLPLITIRLSTGRSRRLAGKDARAPGSFHFHFRFDRHARPQWEVLIRRFGEDDLDRHA